MTKSTSIPPTPWKVWRLLNSVIILFSFFIPWAIMEGYKNDLDHALVFNGFELLQWYARIGVVLGLDSQLAMSTRLSAMTYAMMRCFLGLLSILIYGFLGVVFPWIKARIVDKPGWSILAFLAIALGGVALWSIAYLSFDDWSGNWQQLSSALWGYWLVFIGLASSFFCEFSAFLIHRLSNSHHEMPANPACT